MIELYGSPTPSSYTIAIMLEEIGLNYSVFPINTNSNDNLDLELLRLTPSNVFPIILDRDGPDQKPVVIFEPGAILMYLAEKSGQFFPKKLLERLDVLQWLLFESSKIGPTLGNTKHFMYHAPEEVPYAVKRFNNEAKRIFTIIENQLAENDFIAGEYSIADIAMFPWVREFDRYTINETHIPNICEWLKRVTDREAVNKGWDALADLREN
jgi:GST-like protein